MCYEVRRRLKIKTPSNPSKSKKVQANSKKKEWIRMYVQEITRTYEGNKLISRIFSFLSLFVFPIFFSTDQRSTRRRKGIVLRACMHLHCCSVSRKNRGWLVRWDEIIWLGLWVLSFGSSLGRFWGTFWTGGGGETLVWFWLVLGCCLALGYLLLRYCSYLSCLGELLCDCESGEEEGKSERSMRSKRLRRIPWTVWACLLSCHVMSVMYSIGRGAFKMFVLPLNGWMWVAVLHW